MIHIYHPNKAIKGFACSFWFSDKYNSAFATILRQSGWDDKNQNGIFKDNTNDPNNKVNIKLSFVELGAILDCIERNRPFETFHDAEESPKTIKFVPWMQGDTHKGYSFSILVGSHTDSTFKNSFYIGLTFAEARYLREYLIYLLHKSFGTFDRVARYAPDEAKPEKPETENTVVRVQATPEGVIPVTKKANNKTTTPVKVEVSDF